MTKLTLPLSPAKSLKGKVAVITGASKGLGKAIACCFADTGLNLMLIARAQKNLNHTAHQIQNAYSNKIQVSTLAGDVCDEQFCQHAIDCAVSLFGHINVLVNNAGTIIRQPLTKTTTEQWQRVMTTNVDSVFYLCRRAIPHLPAGSSIINVASTVASVGAANLVAYCASKGAIANFTKALALELATVPITVNAVAPGAIHTDLLWSEHPPNTPPEHVTKQNINTIPQGRIATPQEIARACLFLAQEPHVTGSILAIDGGYTAQ